MQDDNDPLAHYRDMFHLPGGVIYLDGNSLGAMPKTAPDMMRKAVEIQWAEGLIRSWNDAGWWQLPVELGDKIGRLIGAGRDTVVVTDSTSINIYKALHAGLALRTDRSVIIAETNAFPTDLYMSQALGNKIERRLIGQGGKTLPDLLDEDVGVVLLSHVDYRSGELLDMESITAQIHQAGAIVIWDLCHSAGVIPMQLDECNVDFAIGCTYKYLNGGPGAPAFIYANQRHHGKISQPLTGWWGHAEPFAFKPQYDSDQGIRAFLCGTQPILSMQALSAALEITDGIDMNAVREKSKALTFLFAELVLEKCQPFGVELFGPPEASARGSQVSFTHENGHAVMQALIAAGVIGDFRQPNIIRFGFSPLYINFDDVRNAAQLLSDILATGEWKKQKFSESGTVT